MTHRFRFGHDQSQSNCDEFFRFPGSLENWTLFSDASGVNDAEQGDGCDAIRAGPDHEALLEYNRARHFYPEIGPWLREDPPQGDQGEGATDL